MRFHVRCSRRACQARDVFAQHPDIYDAYGHPRKCRVCGHTRFRVDLDRQNRDSRAEGCSCTGYRWARSFYSTVPLHRRGSRFCWYRKDGTQRHPGDADFEDPTYPT